MGVAVLLFTEYTQSHCMAQHITGVIWTFISTSLEEQESLEGHSLHPTFTSRIRGKFSLQHSPPVGYGFPCYFTCIVFGLCTRIDLPDQLALSPSLESDYDYDLHKKNNDGEAWH